MINHMVKNWEKDRDAAVKTLDVEVFRDFYEKYRRAGIYHGGLPKNDHIIEITMRKMLFHMRSATEEDREAARKWLEERGLSTDL